MKKSLEEYFKENYENGVIDHSIRVSFDVEGKPLFYIHPSFKSGDTLDFKVDGNNLKQIR